MAISRRIFRKQYKRPRLRNRTFVNNKIIIEIKRNNVFKFLQTSKKFKIAPLCRAINISSWNSLTREGQLHELLHARRDIEVFAGHHIPQHGSRTVAKMFQAYLPADVWKKMTRQERLHHLQKRNELIKKGVNFSKPQYKKIGYRAYFTNAWTRPVLSIMSGSAKISYLKALIIRAKMHAIRTHQEVEPKISRNAPTKIRTPYAAQQLINFRNIKKINRFVEKNELIDRVLPKKFK